MRKELVRSFICFSVLGLVLTTAAQAADPSLIGYWPFDEASGDTAHDASGNGNDGTLSANVSFVPDGGRWGGAVLLDGTNTAHVEISAADMSATAGSVMMWGNLSEARPSQTGYFFGHTTQPPYANRIQLYMDGGTTDLDLGLGGSHTTTTGIANLQTQRWYHVAMTWDSGNYVVYLDGEVAASGTYSGLTTIQEIAWIGNDGNPQTEGTEAFGGLLDDVALYNRALAQGEIQFVMNGGLGKTPTAGEPDPEDGAIDILRDVILGWAPGMYAATHDVYFGTVLDDVDNADRSNPLNLLVSQGQTAVTYDPEGVLDLGQTYYWRVDEVNAAPDSAIYKGEVWSFTTEPPAYPIENIVATSNAAPNPGTGPENTVNGSGLNSADQHSTAATDMWLGAPSGAEPMSIQYEFDTVYKLHEMLVWNYNEMFELMLGFGLKDVTIEYSENGVDWMVLGDVQFAQATARTNYTANTTVEFGGVSAKYVKITVNSGWGPLGQFGLSEVRITYIPVQAREPEPADGATDVSVSTLLSWRAGREAASHEVSLGTDPEALDLTDTVSAAGYDPGTLDLGTTYYWKVTEVNEAEVISRWEGSAWSFSTQEYLVVDDFESYTDDIDAGETIFDTWIDGWTNDTGSTVGHFDAPFAEQTIVFSGKQSMPLAYDNVGGITISEADRDFDTAQDWSQAGVTALVLHFHGDLDNSAAQLYVKINGVQVVYDGAPESLTASLWKQWTIDLAAVGTNLRSVTTLTIGIEGSGSGILYVDDIRLYRSAPPLIEPVDPGTGDLVAQYAFEDNVNDGTGNGYDGTAMNDPFYDDAAGNLGRALSFDGINDYVELPIGSLLASLSDITVATWVSVNNSTASWQRIFDFGTSSTAGYMFLSPRTATTGPVRFSITPAGSSDESAVEGSGRLPTGWHHLAAVIDSVNMTVSLYIDGARAAEGPTETVPADLGQTTQNWLGRSQYTADGYFNGLLADLSIYDRALSAGEIRYLAGDR